MATLRQGTNSHSGATRLTKLPSGHCFVSVAQTVFVGLGVGDFVGLGVKVLGQGLNSQSGPTRPTVLPSGHSFTSVEQTSLVGLSVGVGVGTGVGLGVSQTSIRIFPPPSEVVYLSPGDVEK